MKTVEVIIAAIALTISFVAAHADEVLPVVPEEKLTEYRNAFRGALDRSADTARPAHPGRDSKHPPMRLEALTDQVKGDWDGKGPPPPRGDAMKAPPGDFSKGFPDALHGKQHPPGSGPGPGPGPGGGPPRAN